MLNATLDDIEIFINFFNFLGTQQLVEAIEKEKSESKKRIKTLESGVAEEMSNNKKELIGKIETVEADIKKKVEMEANETRFVLWQYRLWGFQTRDTKLGRFLPENQHTQRKLMNFEFWINDKLSKSTKT